MDSNDPSKKDIEILFRRLRSIPSNKVCFDCTAKNPTWASVTYGVFICIDCSAVHRGLGVHLTFVRSTQLDTSWRWIQLHKMQLGGNANAELFFTQHNCSTKDAQTKYQSRAAQLYREKLHAAANQAIALHGNKLNLEPEPPGEHKEKDFDFFSEHSDDLALKDQANNESSLLTPRSESNTPCLKDPSFCLSNTNDEPPETKKMITIGLKKVQTKRSGIGVAGRKGGLGAQKIKANFAEIEKEAELADKLKVQDKKEVEEQIPQEEEEKIASIRLAYEDLVIQQKKEEEKLKAVDPKKAKQFERLGMGLGARSGVSHSALNDMQTIQQESAEVSKSERFSFDDFYSSYSPNNAYSMKSSLESRNLSTLLENRDSFKNSKVSDFDLKTPTDDHTPTRKNVPSSSSSSTDAQKKFGSAKAISSDQFFFDSSDSNWERKSNLQRFEGSSSISSADYFGRNETNHRGGIASQIQTPDLEDVKESVRQGVTKVAGRLSSLANGVFSSIQEKYGGY